jgi:hypothetical protein|uniref:tetratricopeptide repeat protein n=1 Tax=Prosthecobacter sp. TaxID=1965333 RepID=UPI00378387B7
MSRNSRQVFLLIVSYTALAVAWGWRLHANDAPPKRDDALLDTTRTEIVSRLATAPKKLQQAAIFQLALLPENEVLALHEWLKDLPEQRLRKLTVQQGPVHAPCPLNTALIFAELERADAPLIEDTRLLISAAGDRLEEPHKLAALELLAAQAANNHEHSLALEIHQRACESEIATWENVLALADAARVARRPAAALKVVNAWLEPSASRLDAALRDDALDLQTKLLLEGSRHAEASRITLDELRSLKLNDAIPPRLMQRALLATHAAGESAELLPWIERHLRTFPDHQLSVEDIAAGKTVSADYVRWLHESAAIADLQNHTSIACDGFFRLAAAGETRVLARLHALATQMGRGQELASLFTALQRRFSVLELAQALADGNAPVPARDLLAAHLKTSPNNRAGWHLLTEIDARQLGAASAPMLWEGFIKRFPGDVRVLKHLAQLQLNNAQYPQALHTLQQISGEDLDEATLRQITALAIQLDDLPAAIRSQQLIVQGSKQASVSDVLTLAALTRQSPDADSQAVLAEAVAKLPAQAAFQQSLITPTTTGEASSFSTAAQAK